jgi:hypothetical protein
MDNWQPTWCGHCSGLCMATTGSMLLWFVLFIVCCFLVISNLELTKIETAISALVIWPLTFRLVVKAEKYEKRQYYLPKSRAVGYLIYLVLPIFVILLGVFLLAYFEVGM